MIIKPDVVPEDWMNLSKPLKPESLKDYHVVCHFRDRPLFIQEYFGAIKLEAIHIKYEAAVLSAAGSSVLIAGTKGKLNSIIDSLAIRLCDQSFAELTASRIKIFAESRELALKHLNSLVSEFAFGGENEAPNFHLVSRCSVTGYLDTTAVTLASEQIMDESEMVLHYGEDFPVWHKQFLGDFKRRSCGITIFRGKPGTGKTTYLRKLIIALHQSHFFLYMPIRIGWMLNAPETVQFWIEQKQKNPGRKLVVILEDAEHFLTRRSAGNSDSVSDLLNAGDGLLGNFLQLHLICTVNCEVDQIDKAVTRSGRMLAYREFKRLTPSQAQSLAKAKNVKIDRQESYSLAEIYHGRNEFELEKAGRKLGFLA